MSLDQRPNVSPSAQCALDSQRGAEKPGQSEGGAVKAEEFEQGYPDRRRSSESASSGKATGDDAEAPAGRRKRRRRQRRRRWKPYFKLTAEERRALELREEKRAERLRASRFAKGIPVAPYNTTQFLLDDRQQRDKNRLEDVDVIVDTIRSRAAGDAMNDGRLSDSLTATESATSSDENLNTMEQEFEHEYELAHTERLESMTKAQLVNEYVCLEKELQNTQSVVNRLRQTVVDLKRRCAYYERHQSDGHTILGGQKADQPSPLPLSSPLPIADRSIT